MRKITLFMASILFSIGVYAQQTLSHTVSQVSDGGGVACVTDPDPEIDGDESVSDNIYYRAYTPADFGFSGDFDAMGISFIALFTDTGGSNPTVTNTVRLYTSSATFPAGSLTEIASKDFTVTAADDGVQFDVMFDSPVTVAATTELVVAVDIAPAPPAPISNYDFRIGANDLGQNDPSYITSEGCALADPTNFANIGFPNTHIILNLLGDTNLSTDDFGLSQVSVYPNPVSDVLNIKVPSNIVLNEAMLFDALGRKVNVSNNNGVINVSDLSSGIYILNIETSVGELSKKIIIE